MQAFIGLTGLLRPRQRVLEKDFNEKYRMVA